MENVGDVLKAMGDKWVSAIVAREAVHEFTGGLYSRGHMANLDSKGLGPPAIKFDRKVAYPVDSFLEWLSERITN